MLIVFDHCLQESEAGGQTLWKSYYHITCLICLFNSFKLALSFVFSKTKMFKLLFILFVMRQLLGNVTSVKTAYLKHTNFHVYLFLRAEEMYFMSIYFLRMPSFWKFQLYEFEPLRKKNKKKADDSRDMQLIFLPTSMER